MSRIIISFIFCLTTFLYLFFYEGDVLYVVQNMLSEGQTHYDNTIGAVLITVVLYLIHLFVLSVTGLKKMGFVLTFFPSFLILSVVTQLRPEHTFSGYFIFITILLILLFIIGVIYCRQMSSIPQKSSPLEQFLRSVWIDLTDIILMVILLLGLTDASPEYHLRAKMEQLIQSGKYAEASRVTWSKQMKDRSLQSLRLYAMARDGEMGERLFAEPINGDGNVVLPEGKDCPLLMLHRDTLLRQVGMNPRLGRNARQRISYALRQPAHHDVAIDMLLGSMLIDRDLNAFSSVIAENFTLNDSLPRHYREALALSKYDGLLAQKDYEDETMESEFSAFHAMYGRQPQSSDSLQAIYGKTFWYYYFQ